MKPQSANKPGPKPKSKIDSTGRECTKCGKYQVWDQFNDAARGPNKKTSVCKTCTQKATKQYKLSNKELLKKKRKAQRRKLKKEDTYLWKAKTLAASWSQRSKKYNLIAPKQQEIYDWLKSQEQVCYYSGVPLDFKFEVDHKQPLARGGTFDTSNLALCTKLMNSIKGAMTEAEFKSFLALISTWEDKGEGLMRRIRQSGYLYK